MEGEADQYRRHRLPEQEPGGEAMDEAAVAAGRGRRLRRSHGRNRRRHTLATTTTGPLPFEVAASPGAATPPPSSSSSSSSPESDAVENIRVVCRLRPSSDQELSHGGESCVVADTEAHTVTYEDPSSVGKKHSFSFNRVFDEYALQEDVYTYAAQPMVDDVLNGFSAAIIAYGQTGAGKTYTMQGPGFDDPQLHEMGYDQGLKGIIPRVMEEIFQRRAQAPPHIKINVSASYLEIYMEKVRDLLAPHRSLGILDQPGGGVMVTGAEVLQVMSSNEIIATMQRGARNRMVAATQSNEESSRGHAVFLITINKHDTERRVTLNSQLYLVDLAGSEKADKTGAEGLRLNEAKKINQSLLALGNVISALSSGDKRHVPYRNSKLTRLLKNSLGGNARTTLIINCSPNSYNALETLSTLRFGHRASKIRNKPVVNEQRSVEVLEALLKESNKKVEAQRQYIQDLETEVTRLRALIPLQLLSVNSGELRGQQAKGKERIDNFEEFEDLVTNDEKENGRSAPEPTQQDVRALHLPSELHQHHESNAKEEHDDKQVMRSKRKKDHRRAEMLHFLCPLTRDVFSDPVFCADGFTYERKAIKQYLKRHHKSPLTGQRLTNRELIPNFHLRRWLADKRRSDPVFSSINFFDVLPTELVFSIFGRLDPISLGRCLVVCRLFEELLQDKLFWVKLLRQDGLSYLACGSKHPRTRYMEHYRKKHEDVRRVSRAPPGSTPLLTLFKT